VLSTKESLFLIELLFFGDYPGEFKLDYFILIDGL